MAHLRASAALHEFGIGAPKCIRNLGRLIMVCDQPDLPAPARKALGLPTDPLIDTRRKIEDQKADIRADTHESPWLIRPLTPPPLPQHSANTQCQVCAAWSGMFPFHSATSCQNPPGKLL